MRHPLLPLIVAALAALPLAATALAQNAPPAADPVAGKALFLRDGCSACHGTAGQGGGRNGPRLAPHPLPPAAILRQLRHPANTMPPYSATVLSDAQAADIIAYLQSIPPGKPASEIPLLRN